MKNCVLLLTACIEPRYTTGLVRFDPNVRLEDYARSLRLWVTQGGWLKIVFADNSGWPGDRIRHELQARVGPDLLRNCDLEILCVEDRPRSDLHYGYSELGILDHAIESSRLLKDADFFLKVTGRLFFPDARAIVEHADKDLEFWVDARRRVLKWNTDQITTQLMLFSCRFYRENMLGIRSKMVPEQPYIENFLYGILLPWRGNRGCRFRWHKNVDPVGIAAHSGKQYGSWKRKMASVVRGVMRRICPDFWF